MIDTKVINDKKLDLLEKTIDARLHIINALAEISKVLKLIKNNPICTYDDAVGLMSLVKELELYVTKIHPEE